MGCTCKGKGTCGYCVMLAIDGAWTPPPEEPSRDSRAEVIDLLREVERHCPCGARPESPNTHPHVLGCPLEKAMNLLREAR